MFESFCFVTFLLLCLLLALSALFLLFVLFDEEGTELAIVDSFEEVRNK